MHTLTPELKQAVERAGDSPLRLTYPETHKGFVLVRAEIFDRLVTESDNRREEASFLRVAKENARARLLEDA